MRKASCFTQALGLLGGEECWGSAGRLGGWGEAEPRPQGLSLGRDGEIGQVCLSAQPLRLRGELGSQEGVQGRDGV